MSFFRKKDELGHILHRGKVEAIPQDFSAILQDADPNSPESSLDARDLRIASLEAQVQKLQSRTTSLERTELILTVALLALIINTVRLALRVWGLADEVSFATNTLASVIDTITTILEAFR